MKHEDVARAEPVQESARLGLALFLFASHRLAERLAFFVEGI
jgi:hypothetical protein